jgi:hypothetical protein
VIGVGGAATSAAIWATLAAGHDVADHLFGQTDRQAAGKGAPSPEEVAAGVNPRRGCRVRVRPRGPAMRTLSRRPAHRIVNVDGVLWILVLAGPRYGSWSFWAPAGPVPWQKYEGVTTRPAEAGRP